MDQRERKMIQYIKDLFSGIWNLLQGMRITMINFIRKPITEQYPENRGVKEYAERFRGELTMPHNANNEHKCTACGICQMNCPNCTFCGLCTMGCPQKAIVWSNNFEHSVFRRETLVKQLNKEGSKVEEKKAISTPQQ